MNIAAFPDPSPPHSTTPTGFNKHWRAGLVFSFLFVLPFGQAFEVPLAVMALLGLGRLLASPRSVTREPGVRILFLLFVAIWLPMLASLPDAVNFQRSLSTAMVFLRFPLTGVFIVFALRDEAARRWIIPAGGFLLLIWAADGLLQLMTGKDVLGFPYNGTRVSGLFHPKLVLGHVLAVASPIVYETIRRHAAKSIWLWLMVAPYLAVIVFTSSRAAWFMAAVAGLLYGLYLWNFHRPSKPSRILAAGLVVILAFAVLLSLQPGIRAKFENTAGLFSGNYQKANEATSLRLPIWQTAGRMIADHWINGVGPRGFRYVYPYYAGPNDPFMAKNPEQGPTHPHQIMLEILAETGLIGFAGILVFYSLLLRFALRLEPERHADALPWLIAATAACFPLNAGLAIYASFWSAIIWWLIALAVAFGTNPREEP